jgi:putative membrane protein
VTAPTPYENISPDQTLLRDQLALDRTTLANERTLLAYVRTAMALFLTGASAMHLHSFQITPAYGPLVYDFVGWAFIIVGAATLLTGYVRYRRIRRAILRSSGGYAANAAA